MMLDLLAAVQSVDPLSVPLWALVAFAAGMYPVGFLFGFGCGGCCDPCAGGCNYCSGYYAFTNNDWGPCYDVFDVFEMTSGVASASKESVFPDGNNQVDLYVDLTESLDCVFDGTDIEPVVIKMWAGFLEFDALADECGCRSCEYLQRLEMRLGIDQDFEPISTSSTCQWVVRLPFDKCSEALASATLSLTKEDIENCLAQFNLVCPFAEDFEGIDLDVTISLAGGCECGACCFPEDVACQSTPELYCEDGFFWVNRPGPGVWQGIGTDCDPNPCV